MVEQRELQEKIINYRILESRLDSLLKEREKLASKLIETQNTLQSIEEVEKGNQETLFPIGSGAYTIGKITDNKKIILGIGANVALEKTIEEGKKTLENRRKEIENELDMIQKNITGISSDMELLGSEIEEMSGNIEKEPEAG